MHLKNIKSEIKKFGKSKVIRAELLKRGHTLKSVAANLGISGMAVKLVISDRGKSKRIASYIEKILEVPEGSLFPYVLEDVEKREKRSKENKSKS